MANKFAAVLNTSELARAASKLSKSYGLDLPEIGPAPAEGFLCALYYCASPGSQTAVLCGSGLYLGNSQFDKLD